MTDALEYLKGLAQTVVTARAELDLAKEEKSRHEARVKEAEEKLILAMRVAEIDRIDTPDNSFTVGRRYSFRVPKDPVSRDIFFAFLQEKGVFDALIGVNSNTLNSWAKKEAEIAENNGVLQFTIPGLEEPKESDTLKIKKRA